MQDILLSISLSTLVGFLLAVPALIMEAFGRKRNNLPVLLEVRAFWGKDLKHKEVFAFGLLVHLLHCMLFGALYPFVADIDFVKQYLPVYGIASIIVFAIAFYFAEGIVTEVVGLGAFWKKEDKNAWMESIISTLILAFLFWLAVQYYQPYYFTGI
ncbi:MAG: hypothetical protein ACD_76C00151G0003 [uncultured bacterium]|nr:MAG: hypothetical protein ACD_76C00151G0003 [uncultured bacterium]HBD04881.1 hypothetical protein [Candidatus Uhrbacteria bacterium]